MIWSRPWPIGSQIVEPRPEEVVEAIAADEVVLVEVVGSGVLIDEQPVEPGRAQVLTGKEQHGGRSGAGEGRISGAAGSAEGSQAASRVSSVGPRRAVVA